MATPSFEIVLSSHIKVPSKSVTYNVLIIELFPAFDLSETGIEKGKKLAEKCNTYVDFFKADITDFRLEQVGDLIWRHFHLKLFYHLAIKFHLNR